MFVLSQYCTCILANMTTPFKFRNENDNEMQKKI